MRSEHTLYFGFVSTLSTIQDDYDDVFTVQLRAVLSDPVD